MFEVVQNGLTEATEEMAVTLRRSAYSTNIKTRADFSCAFFDRDIRAIAQSFSQPVHLGSMVEIVPTALQAYGPERLETGDSLVTNHPYVGGVHLNDITIITPVYYANELFGYVASLAHHVDVGGGSPASVGANREVYQEGIIIPPIRLVRSDEILSDVFDLILCQIRSKHETAGDFRAQLAANNTGVRRLTALIDRHGLDLVNYYIGELIAYSERRTRASISALPHGVYAAEGFVDTDGFSDSPVRLVARLTVDDEGIIFDFTGCDTQRRAPVNSTHAQTLSACAYVLKCLIDQDIPPNHGFYELVKMIAPAGTVVNCSDPSPVVGGWETQTRLIDVMLKALSVPLPTEVPAGSKAMQCHAGFGGINPQTGQYYCFLETLAGGYGGREGLDGPDAVQTHGQNTENAPVEETERNYPVRIERYELVDDSEGPGEYRGGLGLRRDYAFVDSDATFTILADRDREGPWGLFGGLPGRVAEYVLRRDGESVRLGSKSTIEVKAGDVVSYRTCGGGGYGSPLKRDPERVLVDVRNGKIHPRRAREVYGVVIDEPRWLVDHRATELARKELTALGAQPEPADAR